MHVCVCVFGLFVLVVRGRIINPFNANKIRQKMGNKTVVLQVRTFAKENKSPWETREDATLINPQTGVTAYLTPVTRVKTPKRST